jgi:large subunit ribosomal protein L18
MSAKSHSFQKRKERVRIKLKKVSNRNRLSVFKSGQHIYAQIIDDVTARTLVSASTVDKEILVNRIVILRMQLKLEN